MINNPVCIIDSGSGGLTIWRQLRRELPAEATVYIGDHAHLPYGERSQSWIVRRVTQIIRKTLEFNPKIVVIACNTATTAGINEYRTSFPKLPIIGVVPVIKTAASATRSGHIAIFSTTFTSNSEYQKKLLREFAPALQVSILSSGTLVELMENPDAPVEAINRELVGALSPIVGSDCDTVALGCTHFPFLEDNIKKILGPRIALFDSAGAVARHTRRVLENESLAACGKNTASWQFYTTGNPDFVSLSASRLLGARVHFSHLDW